MLLFFFLTNLDFSCHILKRLYYQEKIIKRRNSLLVDGTMSFPNTILANTRNRMQHNICLTNVIFSTSSDCDTVIDCQPSCDDIVEVFDTYFQKQPIRNIHLDDCIALIDIRCCQYEQSGDSLSAMAEAKRMIKLDPNNGKEYLRAGTIFVTSQVIQNSN